MGRLGSRRVSRHGTLLQGLDMSHRTCSRKALYVMESNIQGFDMGHTTCSPKVPMSSSQAAQNVQVPPVLQPTSLGLLIGKLGLQGEGTQLKRKPTLSCQPHYTSIYRNTPFTSRLPGSAEAAHAADPQWPSMTAALGPAAYSGC